MFKLDLEKAEMLANCQHPLDRQKSKRVPDIFERRLSKLDNESEEALEVIAS